MPKLIQRVVRHRRRPGTLVWPARQAIRCHCLECMAYKTTEVNRCTVLECHLWPYRLGSRMSPKEVADTPPASQESVYTPSPERETARNKKSDPVVGQ